jgi:hypothetical protein
MTLFGRLGHWLRSLFSRDPESRQRKRDLKKIHATLAAFSPPIFSEKDGIALPGFARLVYDFCCCLKPLRDLLLKTVASEDARVAQRFHDLVIESSFDSRLLALRASISFDALKERMQRAVLAQEEADKIDRDYRDFVAAFGSIDVAAVDERMARIERASELCRFDYERILGLFDPGVDIEDPKYKPEFHPPRSDQLVPELADLHHALAGFRFDSKVEEGLRVIAARLWGQGQQREERWRRLQGALEKANAMLASDLSPEITLSLARALKRDPYMQIQQGRPRQSAAEHYLARLASQFQKDRERIVRDLKESAIEDDIRKLFGEAELLELPGYDDDMNALLHLESPVVFTHVKAMRLLKSFYLAHFENGCKDPLKRVLVEGFFENKAFHNNLSNLFYLCDKVGTHIQQFEELLSGTGRTSSATLRRYLEEARKGKDVGQFIKKLVDSLNLRAKEIIENDAGLFGALAASIDEIAADYKRPTPEYISNIRSLGGGKNKDIIVSLSQANALAALFLRVMRNFTSVIASPAAAKDAAKEPQAAEAAASLDESPAIR